MTQSHHIKAFKDNAKREFKAGAIQPAWNTGLAGLFNEAALRKVWQESTEYQYRNHF